MNSKIWRNLFLASLAISFSLNTFLLFSKTMSLSGDKLSSCEIQKNTLLKTIGILQENCNNHEKKLDQKSIQDTSTKVTKTLRRSSILINKDEVRLLGNSRSIKGFITIAIPTVKREQGDYLTATLDSIIENTSKEERKKTTIVVFLADVNEDNKKQIVDKIREKYSEYLWNGFLEVIQAPKDFYPPLENLKQKYGDSEARIAWRSKQVVDYAFLFSYCKDMSDFYLQLEDDVISTPKFLASIQAFISVNSKSTWVTLEFSELGFIGKLYHSEDLSQLSEFVLSFYDEQPIDFLLRYYLALKGQSKPLVHLPTLFQHIGQQSSLKEKQQELKDRFFETGLNRLNGDNPPAKIHSTLRTFSMYLPQLAYSSQPGYFWGVAPKVGDYIFVIFDDAVRISKVVFETGLDNHKEDFLRNGRLEASPKVVGETEGKLPICSDYVYLGSFEKGQIEVLDVDKKTKFAVKCLRVSVTEDQTAWMILREIAVWTVK
ncbi:alpha-1,3-mannosyl-glycoprotein 4-beta-N-acetylglucosaminyltransferase C-like [Saccoglossus kowalevskii]|uniref:Alpha-1,3-mannosyl-glycoprotein 4-beta-N-acetylglucosaminyltransferase C-like n=1 Tax=Saccoglossus kowalevskii TaxID=10224 RepID=A0ABM0GW74_SACKO|nr:PREDICTED: alpha-1,3-mannosyl-glycoprotein 4-beta-N-acetylglucosaminyltransferase C-like [Saccoglossus kowalevskii]